MHSDVLIIGAGSSGSVLAERLSADKDRLVTVLEAGSVHSSDPSWVLPIGPDSLVASSYRTSLTAEIARPADIVRGRVFGGSGAINGGYFCRAVPEDFRLWSLPGWGWDDVLSHYRAIETDRDFTGPVHGDAGPIEVRRTREFAAASQRFIEQVGVHADWVADLNAPDGARPGLGPVPLNIDDAGIRRGPGQAFLLPALHRDNLTLLSGTRALRLSFSGPRAVAATCFGPDGVTELTADRIVLSAGAIESAHLLLRSGIGPADQLTTAGVPVVADLPVGQWCGDHPEWLVQVDWVATGHRPPVEVALTTTELEIRPYTCGFGAMTGTPGSADPVHIGISLMRPHSRGRVRLVSADPDVPLLIEHRYDGVRDDVTRLRDGVDLVHEMFTGAIRSAEPMWSTAQHLAATAPMGREDDHRGVLDEQCRVRGIDGLWVVDASAMPELTGRGPHATVVMMAHRAAEFLCR